MLGKVIAALADGAQVGRRAGQQAVRPAGRQAARRSTSGAVRHAAY